jgi:hypothetical protein
MLIDKLCSFSFDRLLKVISVQSIIRELYDSIIYEFSTVHLNQRKWSSLADMVLMVQLEDPRRRGSIPGIGRSHALPHCSQTSSEA